MPDSLSSNVTDVIELTRTLVRCESVTPREAGALQLLVLVPGIDAGGVDITTRGPDLFLTARKARPVRVNWSALRLEDAQQEYHLALRLGHAFDFAELRASLRDGLLTITLPKAASTLARERQVA